MTHLSELFTDHTYRLVLIGTALVGGISAVLGCFLYLRKESLLSDVIAHSALPGTMLAFVIGAGVLGIDGRNSALLIVGSVCVGALAVALTRVVVGASRVSTDAAMAVTLTAFFGAGMWLLDIVSASTLPGKGGIQGFLFGNASVLTRADIAATAVAGIYALGVVICFWNVWVVSTFDRAYAATQGIRLGVADALLFTAIVVAVVIGAKSVGLVLMVACVIMPAAAARQWVRTLRGMVSVAAIIGVGGGMAGAVISILLGGAPTGPVTVLVLFVCVLVSLLGAPRRGLIARLLRRRMLRSALQMSEPVGAPVGAPVMGVGERS